MQVAPITASPIEVSLLQDVARLTYEKALLVSQVRELSRIVQAYTEQLGGPPADMTDVQGGEDHGRSERQDPGSEGPGEGLQGPDVSPG